jgi:glutamine amidotransferase
MPMWADTSFADVASVVTAECLVAAVRSATVGFPFEESGAQPFVAGHRMFSHNGRIEGFPGAEARLRTRAVEALGDEPASVPDARAPLDSALLLALAVGYWRGGAGLGEALAEVVAEVAEMADARLNLMAADGAALAATAYGDSLFVRDDRPDGGPAVLASEPYDDAPSWRRIPDRSLVQVDAAGVTITPLKENRACRSPGSTVI